MSSDLAVILLGAGGGNRLGAGGSKALIRIGGKVMARWAAEALCAAEGVSRLIAVGPPDPAQTASLKEACEGLTEEIVAVRGGARRRDSVWAGLMAAQGREMVLVHDAARPFVSTQLAERVIAAARVDDAAVPAIPVADTLVRGEERGVGDLVPREDLWAVQTPQVFRRDLLVEAHRQADPSWDAPDDGSMVRRLGRRVALVPGDSENFKVTWPKDLGRARLIATGLEWFRSPAEEEQMQYPRVGFGWDVHPLREGRPFHLVGVELTTEFGPLGHSDGDPLSHAVADALLGAAGAGDIGLLFPDTDPRYKGMPGPDLLRETVDHLYRQGWRPLQVDAVLILDRPKIAPHRETLRARLAEILGLPASAVSVKGKRTEGLGGLADGAGVGAQAVATLVRQR